MVRPNTVDFETEKIEGRPAYPPKPVGVSIKKWGQKPKYYAWGHMGGGNNCTKKQAIAALKEIWGGPLCFQNGKFDVDVAEVHCGLPLPKWSNIHDTMFLLFLDDPNQQNLGLKESAERLLDMPPEERNLLEEWLLINQPVKGVKLSKSKTSEHYWAGYISYAPGDIAGKYANGDTDRTEKLFKLLYQKTIDRAMLVPYQREQRLMLILLGMERQGIPVDLKRLRADVEMYELAMANLDLWLIKRLKAPKDINLDSGEELMQALIKGRVVDQRRVPRTKTGKLSFAKDSLLVAVEDKQVLSALLYRASLNTCLKTFMNPWLRTAIASKGFIYTTWNQTRQPSGDSNVGTRTGRLSSTPNFQNMPNEFKPLWSHEKKGMPKAPVDLPPLPKCRSYIVPWKGEVLIDRDYSQQEPRFLAHFEGGQLMQSYQANPWLDLHDNARDELAKIGKIYDRKPVKNTNLGLIYGMGVGKLALKNDMSVQEAGDLKKSILKLYPGLKEMYSDMKVRMINKMPIRTWGGRESFCEPPKLVDGRMRTYDYKMVNTLIQGSSSDATKEAIIRFDADPRRDKRTKLILNVHDQLTASTPKSIYKRQMEVLRQCMESIETDVAMLTEGKVSDKNWYDLTEYDVKGKICA